MSEGERELAERALDLREDLLLTAGDTAGLYGRLDPAGKELTDDQKTEVTARLGAGAACLRRMQKDWDIIEYLVRVGKETSQNMDLRPAVAFLRTMQRSLILAASDNPQRRQHAAPARDLAIVFLKVAELIPG
jgi:hypothetical protein